MNLVKTDPIKLDANAAMIKDFHVTGHIGHNSQRFNGSDEAKTMISNILSDMEPCEIPDYIEHIGFPLSAVSKTEELLPALVGHYRVKAGVYDTDRIAMDLAKYPPIAARIIEIMSERAKV